jgi:hypothetical protein
MKIKVSVHELHELHEFSMFSVFFIPLGMNRSVEVERDTLLCKSRRDDLRIEN